MPEIIFTGPEGRLEGRHQRANAKSQDAPYGAVLVMHPHPQHGGTMNNRLVYTLYHAFVQEGFSALRFNFRGVGRSQGSFAQGEGEVADAAAALNCLQNLYPETDNFWVAGFSFGAWASMQLLMRRPEVNGFVVISPPANRYDFSFLAPCPASGLIIQGDKDEIVAEPAVSKLVTRLRQQRGLEIGYRVIKGANHFFGKQIERVENEVKTYLRKWVRQKATPPTT